MKYAVDYHLFGDSGMRRTECVINNSVATEESLARLIEKEHGYGHEYVTVYQFVLQEEPRASYNRRL